MPERSMKMTIRRFEVERISVTSSKPFEAVVAALNGLGGWGSGRYFSK